MNCKLADFGLARYLYSDQVELLSTWRTTAPEVLNEKPYDERADTFSFGTQFLFLDLCSSVSYYGL